MKRFKFLLVLFATTIFASAFMLADAGQQEKMRPMKHPLRISGQLNVTPAHFKGKCPKEFKFNGRITVSGVTDPVTIKYKFVRSDGATAAEQELTFEKNGTQKVTDTWQLGGAGERFRGWEELIVTQPMQHKCGRANFTLMCDK